MPIINLFGVIFEWHDPKFELVNAKRGYSLSEVASVFDDDYSITQEDKGGDYGEQRLLTTGISNQFRLVTVAWVERADTVRVITAFSPRANTVRVITAFSPSKQQENFYYARRKKNY